VPGSSLRFLIHPPLQPNSRGMKSPYTPLF
jgi:hypothetical protein